MVMAAAGVLCAAGGIGGGGKLGLFRNSKHKKLHETSRNTRNYDHRGAERWPVFSQHQIGGIYVTVLMVAGGSARESGPTSSIK